MAEFDPCKLYFQVVFLALLLPLASGDCITLDLGMQNRSIPDDKVTASSEKSTANTPAKNGRLNYTSGSSWCAATSDSNPYLQIDLQTLHIICAVSTQGNSKADQWVKNYTLKSSTDGSTWKDYEENGQVKSLQGNNNRNSEVKHILYEGVLARYMRFLPKTHQGSVCMRTEVFGVKQKPENIALGKPTAQSSTYSGSSGSGESKKAVDGNPDTNFSNGHCTHTTLRDPNWWRVDLGSDTVPVSAIYIVNRFSSDSGIQQRSKDYKITLGGDSDVTNNTVCVGLYSFINFKASAVCFTNPLKTGRYVGIMTTKSQVLHLCEVEIYSRENLAFGKPTAQFSGQYKDGKSSKAVDGNSNTHFQSGTSKGSCTMTNSGGTTQPWWRVDLRQDESVSEVYIVNRLESDCTCGNRLDDFDIRVGSTSSGGGVTNPRCGGSHSVPTSEGASFFCHPSLKGRYVTIKSNVVAHRPLTLCEVEVYSERRACPMQAIGVASSDAFPDNTFSASSSSGSNVASKGRLNADGAWLPNDDNNANDYLQIDLQYEFVICAVATQGKSNADEWTTKYKLQLSLSTGSINWFTYQENKADKVFNGNSGRNDIVKHSLKEFASARFIRFLPTNYSTHKALRVEVFGILLSAVPSQAPSDLNVTASSSTIIVASWQLPPVNGRHGIITGYKLFYKNKDSAGSMLIINSGTTFTRDATGLDKYTEYEFQVLAFTSAGDGPLSSVKVERTKEDVPSQAPSGLNVTASSSTRITASWQLLPENVRHGIIKGYKLFYRKKDSSGSFTMLRINDETILTKDVTGLEKYTEYEFKVLAFTSVGDGPKSSVKTETTKEDVPSQPPASFSVAALSSTIIKASWKLPPINGRNGIITGFKLFYREKDPVRPFIMLPINDGAIRTKRVTALKKYTEYEFQVLAFTSVGDGPNSTVEDRTTNEDAPSQPPTSFSVAALSSTSIRASWQLPPINGRNGIITGFKLFYKISGSTGSPTMLRINGGAIRARDITKLEKYTEYEFQVLAFTIVDDGPKSTAEVERTKEDVPGPPVSVSSFDIAPNKSQGPRINLTWSAPVKANGIIRSYTVFYNHSGDTQKELSGIDALSYSVDVLGGVTYQFLVRAVTIKPGQNASLTVHTKEYEPNRGPESISDMEVNSTTFQITWIGLPKEVANGIIIMYQVRLVLKENCTQVQSVFYSTFNTTTTDLLLSSLSMCARYEVSVRGYTVVGPGPYSQPIVLQTLGVKWSKETPSSPSFSQSSSEGGITAKITLPHFPGNAKFFQVIVVTFSSNYTGVTNSPESFTPQDMLTYEDAHQSPIPAAYVTFQFGGNNFDKYQEFIVGNGAQSNSRTRNKRSGDDDEYYHNKPLQPNTNYRVFLRAFVTETVYISSNFVEIETKDKPVIKDLPQRTIVAVGALAILPCLVSRDPDISVTWSKDGNTSIPRAQFDNDGHILVIKDVLPRDSGVYVCKASNRFGESRTTTTLIVAVPPSIIEDVNPPSVICERQTLCSLSCHATSNTPFNYSWTKNGQVPVSDDVKIMNNRIVVTPRDAKDYGVYVCHATNSFGSTAYKITLSEGPKGDGNVHNIFIASVIALSCIVFVLLVVIGVLIWRLRRAVPNNRTTSSGKAFSDDAGQPDSPRDQNLSEPGLYMELHTRPSQQQLPTAPQYQTLQGENKAPGYYNVVLNKENKENEDAEIYDEIGNAQC